MDNFLCYTKIKYIWMDFQNFLLLLFPYSFTCFATLSQLPLSLLCSFESFQHAGGTVVHFRRHVLMYNLFNILESDGVSWHNTQCNWFIIIKAVLWMWDWVQWYFSIVYLTPIIGDKKYNLIWHAWDELVTKAHIY